MSVDPSTTKNAWRNELEALQHAIDTLPLSTLQKSDLVDRYVSYIRWVDGDSRSSLHKWYHLWRLVLAISAALVVVIGGASLGSAGRWTTVGIGVLIATVTAIDQIWNPGPRSAHGRKVAELMKGATWTFIQRLRLLTNETDIGRAYEDFIARMEAIVRDDIDEYVGSIGVGRRPTVEGGATRAALPVRAVRVILGPQSEHLFALDVHTAGRIEPENLVVLTHPVLAMSPTRRLIFA